MKMKKFVKIFAFSAALLTMGCEQFLTVNPQDSLVKENYYTSSEAVRANTATLYSHIKRFWKSHHTWL